MKLNRDLIIVLALLLVNLIAAAVYLIVHLKRGMRRKGIRMACFMLIYPIVGGLFMAIAELVNFILHQRQTHKIDLNELSFSKERLRLVTDDDMEKAMDTVPTEEALLIADRTEKRQAFMDLLKSDEYSQNIEMISSAVENDDMEVAHYAASFVTDAIARYKTEEAKLREKLAKEASEDNLTAYVDYVEQMLTGGGFNTIETGLYLDRLDKAATMLYQKAPERLRDVTMEILVDMWTDRGQAKMAEPWVARAQVRYRSSLECLKICLRYYYTIGDRTHFFRVLDEGKHSAIVLDNEALEWVRFFTPEPQRR